MFCPLVAFLKCRRLIMIFHLRGLFNVLVFKGLLLRQWYIFLTDFAILYVHVLVCLVCSNCSNLLAIG